MHTLYQASFDYNGLKCLSYDVFNIFYRQKRSSSVVFKAIDISPKKTRKIIIQECPQAKNNFTELFGHNKKCLLRKLRDGLQIGPNILKSQHIPYNDDKFIQKISQHVSEKDLKMGQLLLRIQNLNNDDYILFTKYVLNLLDYHKVPEQSERIKFLANFTLVVNFFIKLMRLRENNWRKGQTKEGSNKTEGTPNRMQEEEKEEEKEEQIEKGEEEQEQEDSKQHSEYESCLLETKIEIGHIGDWFAVHYSYIDGKKHSEEKNQTRQQ